MILSTQAIRRCRIVTPFNERTLHGSGLSYGVGPASYDVRIAQDVFLDPFEFELASIIEHIRLPRHISAQLADKSTWARQGLSLFNTFVDPGFQGYLTIEMINLGRETLDIKAGTPIAQLVFSTLDESTEKPYSGKYNNQPSNPVAAIFEGK